MSRPFSLDTTLKLKDGTEVEVTVEGSYGGGSPMVHTYCNGDPGHPGEPPEVEISSIATRAEGREISYEELEDSVAEALEVRAIQYADELDQEGGDLD